VYTTIISNAIMSYCFQEEKLHTDHIIQTQMDMFYVQTCHILRILNQLELSPKTNIRTQSEP